MRRDPCSEKTKLQKSLLWSKWGNSLHIPKMVREKRKQHYLKKEKCVSLGALQQKRKAMWKWTKT